METGIFKALAEPMEYKTYTKRFKTGGGVELAYIDARQVMDRLDEVLTPAGWQCEYKEVAGKIYCGIGIKFDNEWIWKWDVGTESEIEEDKGEASDAFKRAGVKWGIGRFLYNIKPEQGNPQVRQQFEKKKEEIFSDMADEVTGEPKEGDLCPQCGKGHLVTKSGKWGPFLACDDYPTCRYIPKKRDTNF